ncbi:MAG: pyruvate synthase, partial [Alphaproteobacteria bacterium]|nr:pyruvate synthase [Alphaproteobacteria bacterium]
GLGGRDIGPAEFYRIVEETTAAAGDGKTPPPRLLYAQAELSEMRKLQAIAHIERTEEVTSHE